MRLRHQEQLLLLLRPHLHLAPWTRMLLLCECMSVIFSAPADPMQQRTRRVAAPRLWLGVPAGRPSHQTAVQQQLRV